MTAGARAAWSARGSARAARPRASARSASFASLASRSRHFSRSVSRLPRFAMNAGSAGASSSDPDVDAIAEGAEDPSLRAPASCASPCPGTSSARPAPPPSSAPPASPLSCSRRRPRLATKALYLAGASAKYAPHTSSPSAATPCANASGSTAGIDACSTSRHLRHLSHRSQQLRSCSNLSAQASSPGAPSSAPPRACAGCPLASTRARSPCCGKHWGPANGVKSPCCSGYLSSSRVVARNAAMQSASVHES